MGYDFSPAARKEILDALAAKVEHGRVVCPLCHHWKWTMPDGYIALPLLSSLWASHRVSQLPSAALICDTCGNTILINLMVLGLGHLVGPSSERKKPVF